MTIEKVVTGNCVSYRAFDSSHTSIATISICVEAGESVPLSTFRVFTQTMLEMHKMSASRSFEISYSANNLSSLDMTFMQQNNASHVNITDLIKYVYREERRIR